MKSSFEKILNGFTYNRHNMPYSSTNAFSMEITKVLRDKIIALAHINTDRYLVSGSAGKGRWAEIPWVGIMDRNISISATKGFGIVYLFNGDMSGIYLSLIQGWSWYRKNFGTVEGRLKITSTSQHLRSSIHSNISNFPLSYINLNAKTPLGKGYQNSNIIAKYYSKDAIPSDTVLADDLRELMGIFNEMNDLLPDVDQGLLNWVNQCQRITESGIEQNDESYQEEAQSLSPEDFQDRPEHIPQRIGMNQAETRYRRNPQKAQNALNKADYRCEVDPNHQTFIAKASGRRFVEAHHLIPLSKQDGYLVSLDVEANIIALCPNCHKKIHLGEISERNAMQRGLIEKRKDRLRLCGIVI